MNVTVGLQGINPYNQHRYYYCKASDPASVETFVQFITVINTTVKPRTLQLTQMNFRPPLIAVINATYCKASDPAAKADELSSRLYSCKVTALRNAGTDRSASKYDSTKSAHSRMYGSSINCNSPLFC